MSAGSFVDYLSRYAASFAPPVLENTRVRSVHQVCDGFEITTTCGTWSARNVVVASGAADRPNVPSLAGRLSADIAQLTTTAYRNPTSLPDGGVLVVGASASGVQIADELRRAGRRVLLAVGRHSRLPRRYRGMDIMWWLAGMGVLDKPLERTPSLRSTEPSLQLIGRPGGVQAQYEVDLVSLQRRGVWLTGRLTAVDSAKVSFAEDLAETTAASGARQDALLDRIDSYVATSGLEGEVEAPTRPERLSTGDKPVTQADLSTLGIGSVVWATGFRRSYPWLQVPALDPAGELRQVRGVTEIPGLYTVGQRWQSRRNSSFIDGARHDAESVVRHLAIRRALGRPHAADLAA
jgi:putative flavoprotein involved in K+ transport